MHWWSLVLPAYNRNCQGASTFTVCSHYPLITVVSNWNILEVVFCLIMHFKAIFYNDINFTYLLYKLTTQNTRNKHKKLLNNRISRISYVVTYFDRLLISLHSAFWSRIQKLLISLQSNICILPIWISTILKSDLTYRRNKISSYDCSQAYLVLDPNTSSYSSLYRTKNKFALISVYTDI